MKRWGLVAGRILLGGLLLVWLSRSRSIEWGALRGLYERWGLTLLALAVLVVTFAVTSWRLCRLYAAGGLHLTLADAIRLNLVSNLFNLFVPLVGGDAARMYYAVADKPGQRTAIAAILFFDRVVGLVTLLLCPILLMPAAVAVVRESALLQSILLLGAAAASGLVASGILMTSRRVRGSRVATALMNRLPLQARVETALDTLAGLRDQRSLIEALAISIIAHLLSALVVVILLSATGGPFAFNPVAFLSLVGFMANSIPVTPGGIGLGEAAFDSLFGLAGIVGGAPTMIAWRLLLLSLAPGGLWVVLRGRRLNRITTTA